LVTEATQASLPSERVLELIKKRDQGVGLTASSLPSLIISRKSSVIRFNGHPYYHQLQQGRLLLYASSSEDPLLLLLNLLLTKISYIYAAPDWFAEDSSLENLLLYFGQGQFEKETTSFGSIRHSC